MDLLGSSTTDEDSALEGPTSDSSSSTSQLNNGDVLFTHFDFVTGTKVSNRLAYVFGILESCLYGSGPEGGVYERVYLSFIEDGDFDIIWLMWREGDEERLADMIPLHRWERVPHFAIQALRTRLASVLNTGPSHPDQPTADDTVYRRYAIAWKICNSRAMHEAWRLCGVHCRFDWDLGRLIKVWYEGLHEPGSPPRSPAHDLWKDRMRAEGHDCYIGLASNAPRAMALWVGMMSWMEGGSDIHPICLDPTHCAASASVLQQPVCSHGVAMYDSAHPTVDCRGVCHPQTVLILIHAPGFDIDIYNQDELESPLKAIGYGAWFRLEEFLASRVPTGTPNLRLLPWRNTYPIAAQDSLAVAICNYYYPGSLLEQYNHLRETGGNNGPAHCDIATSIGVLLAHMLGLDCSIDKWRDEIESLRSIFAELPDLDGPSSLRVEDWIRRNIIANDHTCHESIDRYSLQLWVSARLFIAAQAHDPLEFLGFEVDHPDDQSDCRACGVLKCLSHDGLLVAGGCFSKGAHAWDDILELWHIVGTCSEDQCTGFPELLFRRLFSSSSIKDADGPENVGKFLDFLQRVIDTLEMGSSYRGGPIPWHLSDSMSKALHRLQVKVACQNLKIPETLALSDVTVYNSQKPVDGGGFSDIFRGHWDSGSVCIKKLRVFMRTRNEQESRMMKMFCNEALIWSHLHHPNVLQFLGFDMTSFHPYICMVSPWMENGNVLSYIRENPVSEVDTQRLVCEVSRGLEYIHGRNLVHGDIKGANVVVDASGRACLADFGLAGFAQATQGAYTTETREGSKRWMAPELLNWRIPLRRTQESDVYALGCVCLEVYTKDVPWAGTDEWVALKRLEEGE